MSYDPNGFSAKANKPSYSGGDNFVKKPKQPEILMDPFIPIGLFLDDSAPDAILPLLLEIQALINARKLGVRLCLNNELEKSFKAGCDKIELYAAWKGFNEIDTKFYFNTESSKMLANKFFPAHDKVPDVVKSILARNARMVFGDKLTSPILALITWTQDGAERSIETGRNTGRPAHLIKMADYLKIPVFNLLNEESVARLKSYLELSQ